MAGPSSNGSSPDAADPMVGQTLVGRYRLTRKVGEGGMGAVYEAIQEALGRSVAVKILRDKYLDRPEVAQRLVKEAQLASSIEHEHIVRILDSGATPDGRPFLVMEHLRGESLAERIRREQTLPEAFVIELGVQTGQALTVTHAHSIVHRDIKPENLFLVENGEPDRPLVKIVDFGISKSLAGEGSDSNLRLTATGMVLGTPLYMSPEQARGDDQLDHRVDVYSLGVILYEALTGEVPFRANNYLGVISQVLSADVPTARELRPELSISEGLSRVVARAMARDREARYPTMQALVDDLEQVRAGRAPSTVGEAAPIEPPRRTAPWWLLGVGLGLGALALLTRPWALSAPDPAVVPVGPPVVTPSRVDAAVPQVGVRVVSEPPGAEIFIDDRSYGTTPGEVHVAPGKLRLGLRLAGHEDAAAEAIAGADTEVRVVLRPSPRHPEPARTAHPVHTQPRPATRPPASQGGETLPNPY